VQNFKYDNTETIWLDSSERKANKWISNNTVCDFVEYLTKVIIYCTNNICLCWRENGRKERKMGRALWICQKIKANILEILRWVRIGIGFWWSGRFSSINEWVTNYCCKIFDREGISPRFLWPGHLTFSLCTLRLTLFVLSMDACGAFPIKG
jgi:hypothetical protein